MGHSRASKEESHERIVQAAAALFREQGLDGIGLADLMKEAGLTIGGFYKHFGSREELIAEAVQRALQDGGKAVGRITLALDATEAGGGEGAARGRKALLAALVDGYLSAAHRDGLASSCAVTTLAGDVSRSNEEARGAYTRQVGSYLELLTRLITGDQQKDRQAKAVTALATLVGALSMARAVNDEELSREILATAAEELKSHLG